MIAPALVLALVGFGVGTERLWRRAGRGRVVRGSHIAAYVAGLGAVAVAAAPPLDDLAHQVLWGHMVQHLLLILLAPVLLVLARPGLPLAQVVPGRVLRRLRRHRPGPGAALGATWTLHVVVVLGWHLPALYGLALAQPAVHAAEHATMLGSATLLWGVLLRRDPRGRTSGLAALAAAAAGLVTGAVGVVLVFSPTIAYPWYLHTAAARGMSAGDDQVVAGVIMWGGGGLAYAAATCTLVLRWLGGLERSAARRVPGPVGWLLVLVVVAGACTTRGTTAPTAEQLGAAAVGRELVVTSGCTTCHDVPGVAARGGRVGPSLDGFADRQVIAGTLPNTPENLIRWLEDPQAVDPGNVMPDVGLSTAQAADVAAFLSTLD